MFGRFLLFVVALLVAGRLGWGVWGWPGACLGMGLLATVLQLLDKWSASRTLQWLRRSTDEPLIDPPSPLFGAWGEVADRVRQRKRHVLKQLDQSKQTLHAFLDAIQASPNGVLILNADARIEWMNASASLHFGLNAEGDLGQHIVNLVRDPVFTDYLHAQMQPEVKTAGSGITLTRWAHAQSVLKVQLHPYGEGQRLMLSQDFTAIAKAESMQRDFVANVSHEIRTPLTVLSGFIETMQTLPLEEHERANYLDLMAKQAARQQALISDLLMLSKLEGRAMPGLDEEFDLRELMAACATEATALSQQVYEHASRPQVLQFDAPEGLRVVGIRSEWHSACINLINNAVRYSGEGGRVSASWVRLPDGSAEFVVQDTGAGIAPEHLSRLSERFYRVDSSRSRESGGTGLGLAITRQIAQRHGGELVIQSTLGKGSCFVLRLPASRVKAR